MKTWDRKTIRNLMLCISGVCGTTGKVASNINDSEWKDSVKDVIVFT